MAWWKIGTFVGFLTAVFLRRLLRQSRICPSKEQMHKKTVIITGANSGIGKAAALEIARRKARVILACRNLQSAEDTVREIQASTGNNEVIPAELDLASLTSVRHFCKQILLKEPRIDVLINNAGVFQCPYMKTEEGFEMQMGVNHFGHFLLTALLLERIKDSAPSRIVIVSSSLSKRGSINFDDINGKEHYDKRKAYSDSKLANLLFAQELNIRLADFEVDVFPLHPGMVITNLGRHVVSNFFMKSIGYLLVVLGMRDANEGCQCLVYCSVAKELKGKSGLYIDKNFEKCSYPPKALDYDAAKQLWKLSEHLTNS